MKVLLCHDHYRSGSPSGEDTAYRNERALLESSGVEVVPFECFNDRIDEGTFGKRIRLAADAAWSEDSYGQLRRLIARTQPDVAHFHNTFPLISPSGYQACRDEGVPVVQTLHNYRLICPGALMMRNGRPCEDCVGHTLAPALQHRCYRGSLAATAAVVWMLASNRARGSYARLVDRYIALTEFAAAKLIAGGLPADRLEVRPNFLPVAPPAGEGGGGYGVYVGRLSSEKGVHTLVRAWQDVKGLRLVIIGDGPLRAELQRHSESNRLPIEFVGHCVNDRVLAMLRCAEMVVIPSECYEGFPMAVVEAYASGTPVAVSRIGSLDEIVIDGESGVKFAPGDAADLAAKVNALCSNPTRLRAMRRSARALFEAHYTAERSLARIMDIYGRLLHERQPSANGRT